MLYFTIVAMLENFRDMAKNFAKKIRFSTSCHVNVGGS